MKTLILILLVLTGCAEPTQEEIAACIPVEKIKIAEVEGCSVYEVWAGRRMVEDVDGYRCRNSKYFLFTKCPNSQLRWKSGKASSTSNLIVER